MGARSASTIVVIKGKQVMDELQPIGGQQNPIAPKQYDGAIGWLGLLRPVPDTLAHGEVAALNIEAHEIKTVGYLVGYRNFKAVLP